MKGMAKALVLIAAAITVIGVLSRFTLKPVVGLEARAMVGFAGLLLLFAIALQGLE
jgi:hypothetical protein